MRAVGPRCERCGTPLAATARSIARYCSARCRVAAHRAAQAATDPVPSAMKRRAQWVRYSARKAPLSVVGGVVRPASSTDRTTWSTYAAAARTPGGRGLGFVLDPHDGIVCIDLDHALVRGQLLPWAREIVDRLPATYVEVSPSGTGLHIWGRGVLERGRKIRRGEAAIELYDRGRYITVTRRPFEGAPSKLADLSAVISGLL